MTGDPKAPKFSEAAQERLKWHVSRYPHRKAALLPALHLAQTEFGYLTTEVMDYVAGQLDLPPIDVYEAATFYTMYHKKPAGRHCVWVCTNIGCYLNGADDLLTHLEGKLGIKSGGTTADGKFSLFSVECLANCDQAPTAQVDDDYHDRLTNESVDRLLDSLP